MKPSEQLKTIRRKTGETQTQLARRMAVSLRTLQKWEQDIARPRAVFADWIDGEHDHRNATQSK